MKPALLVIDVQKQFFDSNAVKTQSLNEAIEAINWVMDLFRSKGLPVICVQHMDKADGLVPGAAGFDLPDSLKVLASDEHVVKVYGNSFNQTPLLEILKKLDVDTVFLTGYCAEYCVLSTCRGAEDVDIRAILVSGALASGHPERIPFVEAINDTISLGALETILN